MSNRGFETPPAAHIQLIRDNLHDRYAKGFPIIKEILQNADDAAEATCLDFGWCPGFPDDAHPLLRGPAVFFVNDGKFTGADEKAIRLFGLGYKAAERASVGKFGLGLKSVFHLCEAFFYLWHPPHNGTGATVSGNILNPWSGLQHAAWDDVSVATLQTMRAFLSPLLPENNWFCLWVPLRRRSVLEGIAPIVEAYPGDQLEPPNLDAVFCEELAGQLSRVLPQLHHVRTLNAWMAPSVGHRSEKQFTVALTPHSSQRRFPDALPETERAPLLGHAEITWHHTDAASLTTLTYAGFEALAGDCALKCLVDSEYWPKGISLNPDATAWVESREKAVPHGLVNFISRNRASESSGRLTISWAVFLPVGEGNEERTLESGLDVQLTLHGYFFLDAGRQRIEGIENDEPSEIADEIDLRRTWNVRMRRLGVLPLLIPALESWIRETNVPQAAVHAVTKALSQSQLYSRHREEIAENEKWARRVLKSGAQWERIPATVPILEVPAPPQAEPDRPFSVFPTLAHIAESHALIHRGTPFLAADGPAFWPGELTVNLITSVPAEMVFASRAHLQYFADALDTFGIENHDEALKAVGELLRKAFREVSLSDLRGNAASLKRVIEHLPVDWFFSIPQSVPADLNSFLARLDLDCIPVSDQFFTGEGTLLENDLSRILKAFANPPDALKQRPDWPKVCSDFIVHALEVKGDKEIIRTPPHNQYKLFRVKDCASETEVLESATAIAQAFDRRTAFALGQLLAPEGLAHDLQQALQALRILLLPAESYKAVLGEARHLCDAAACVDVLETVPALREPGQRAALLSALLAANLDFQLPQPRKAVRYLLHGSPEHYDDAGLLVAANTANEEDIWTKLVRLIVPSWRYVPRELANVLNPEHSRALDVTPITPDGTLHILRESMESLRTLDLTTLSATEREQLLDQIIDDDVLKRLPIHETMSGQLISVCPNTYLDAGIQPRTALGALLKIVRRLPTKRHATIQEEFLDSLTPVKLLELALKQENPAAYWQDIAAALKETRAQELDALAEQLRERAWMLLTPGGSVAPRTVLEINGLDQALGRLVFPHDSGCIPVHAVLRTCWEHPGVQRHKEKMLPPFQYRLEMLGEVLACQQTEEYRCGLSSLDDVQLQDFVYLFAGSGVLPVADIIQKILAKHPNAPTQICHYLLPHVGHAPCTDKLVRIMSHLANGHMNAGREEKEKWKRWHDQYLEVVRQSTNLAAILPQIKLRNRAGRWRATTELCVWAENIRDEDLLDARQAELLGLAGAHADPETELQQVGHAEPHVQIDEIAFDQSAHTLREYFRPWRERLPEELIGALLAFLGDHPAVRNLAKEHLGQRSIEATRDLFHWDTMMGLGVGRDEDVHTAMIKQRFLVSISAGDTVDVTSIAGTSFKAMLKQDADSIFVGATFKNVWSAEQERAGYRITRIDLRQIDIETVVSDSTLSHILRNSLDRLFSFVYRRAVPSLDEFWMDMAKSEQLDIDIARNMLLESAFFYVGQLGISKQLPELQGILTRYDQVRKQIAEEEHAAATTGRIVGDTGRATALKEVKLEFVERLESDPEVQTMFLAAIRKKVGEHYQYSPQSVPFEFFQNADDATIELNEMLTAAGLPPQQEAFVVAWQDNTLNFMHWGRPINKFRESGFEQGQERGFDRDLERMLVLNASDKNVLGDGSSVTGKFGLGFKSVFLICDRPKIRSGRLGFEILGGMWPKAVPTEDLADQLRDVRPSLRSGTIVALEDMRETTTLEAIIQRFHELAGILLAFSRNIKSIELRQPNSLSIGVEWREEPLNDSATLVVAQVDLPPDMARSHVLKIKAAQGSLLFKMDGCGFARLPDCVPTIWVTAPTEETSDLGFAINGPFPLDVGRARLGRDSNEYRTLAHAISGELGKCLCELYDRGRSDWAGLSRALGLLHDLDEYQFWESFWILCVAPFAAGNRDRSNEAYALAREILWSAPDRGGAHLLRSREAVPTGLWGAYRMLTKSGEIASVVLGVLEDENLFSRVSKWEAAAILLTPGRTVSASRYWALTRLKMIEADEVEKVSLRTILEADVHEGACVDPEKAAEFGTIITREFLQSLERGTTAQQDERNSLLELLTTYRFQAQDGSVQSAQDLLVAHGNETEPSDEGLRAAFAPASIVLNGNYCDSDASCAFFLACRPRMYAPVERLREWAIVAATQAERSAVLTYLLKGELGRELGHELRGAKAGTWFETRQQIEFSCDLTPDDIHEICGLLGIYPSELTLVPPTTIPGIDAAEALKQILAWWLSVKDEKTSEYEQQLYPDGVIDFLSADYDSKDEGQRRSWFTLFLLGMTHTMGRARPEQHRNFVNLCAQKRWLDVFVAKESSAEDWIRVLDEYIDNPIDSGEFSHWMKLFPNIYRVARYLDEYVGAFIAIEGLQRTFDLKEITILRSSPVFQGGGHDAPDLSRTLGIGACFVMRELVRKQILKNPHAHRYCFTPTKRVRDVFQAFGCADVADFERDRNAIYIYRFVAEHLGEQDATFDLSFDVPFYFLAQDPSLQQQTLGRLISVAGAESESGDFVTLGNGRVIPRWYMHG
ncbi:MAG: hypothetical protein AMXMBFR84_26690 [Candidatus Hydrogenedentota bacterium]